LESSGSNNVKLAQTEVQGTHQLTETNNLTPLENFTYALKSKDAKRQYPSLLNRFLCFLNLEGDMEQKCENLLKLAKSNPSLFQSNLIRYCNEQKRRIEQEEISEGTMRNYVKAIKLFCEMNEINVFWKKINKGLPVAVQASDDRPPTIEEILDLIKDYPDRRLKVIVLIMVSSGIRIGAWNYLQWKHVEPIYEQRNESTILISAKITVYAGTPDKYYSFITPEAYQALKDWMDYRTLHGEKVTPESWLMRDTWQKIDRLHGHRIGLAKFPKKFDSEGIRTLLDKAWKIQGVREKLSPSIKHHPFKSSHGFRKFFQTTCEQAMISANVERLMGHSNGLKDSYYKPTEKEVLEDYKNVVDLLTLQDENKLRLEMIDIVKSKQDYELESKLKLVEKDEQLKKYNEQHQQDIDNLKKEMVKILKMIQQNPSLANVKPEALAVL
jgi:integrase